VGNRPEELSDLLGIAAAIFAGGTATCALAWALRRLAKTRSSPRIGPKASFTRSELEKAQALMNAYGAVLEREMSEICSEELLPAPKAEIKAALILAARASRAAGQNDLVEQIRTGFAYLARFVPASEVESAPLDPPFRGFERASPPDVTRLAQRVASNPESAVPARFVEEFSLLVAEFDAVLGREERGV
jgi:hypothetical protein